MRFLGPIITFEQFEQLNASYKTVELCTAMRIRTYDYLEVEKRPFRYLFWKHTTTVTVARRNSRRHPCRTYVTQYAITRLDPGTRMDNHILPAFLDSVPKS